MAFGDDYRKEVNDVNEGRTTSKSTLGTTTSRASAGRQVDVIDQRGETEGLQKLTKFIAGRVSVINNRQQQADYDEAFTSNSETAQAALDAHDNPLMDFVFGKSSAMKGFADNVIQHETLQKYATDLGRMDEDVKNYKTLDEYKAETQDKPLTEALKRQKDKDVRTGMVKQYTKQAGTLASQFTQKRAVYEGVLRRQSVNNNVLQASDLLEQANANGSPEVLELALDSIKDSTTKHPEMSTESYQTVMTNAVAGKLGQGSNTLYKHLNNTGFFDNFEPDKQNQLDSALQIYQAENSRQFFDEETTLDQAVFNQDANFESQLNIHCTKYNEQCDKNKWRAEFQKRQQVVEKAQTELRTNTNWLTNGDPNYKTLGQPKKTAAWDNKIKEIGTAEALKDRRELYNKQIANGETPVDLNATVTQEEMDTSLRNNPPAIIATWKSSQQKLPLLQRSLVQLSNLFQSEELTSNEMTQVNELQTFINSFQTADKLHFADHFTSDSEAKMYTSMNYFTNTMGFSQRRAILEIRKAKDRDPYEWDEDSNEKFNTAEDLLREVTDSSGFERWNGWSRDPANQEQLQWATEEALEKAIIETKNVGSASALAKLYLLRNTTRVGEHLILDGKKLDKNSYNGSINDYIELIDQDEQAKDLQELAGFPRDRPLSHPANTIKPYPNGQGFTVSSKNDVGMYIYREFDVPKNINDMPREVITAPKFTPTQQFDPETGRSLGFKLSIEEQQRLQDVERGITQSDSTQATPLETANIPKGKTPPAAVRNNNPGNLRGLGIDYEGKTGETSTGSGKFSTFDTPLSGMRALAMDLRIKINRGVNTIEKIIKQFSPDTDPENKKRGLTSKSYINSVARRTGIAATKILTLQDREIIMEAMTFHEAGFQPWSTDLIKAGITEADK